MHKLHKEKKCIKNNFLAGRGIAKSGSVCYNLESHSVMCNSIVEIWRIRESLIRDVLAERGFEVCFLTEIPDHSVFWLFRRLVLAAAASEAQVVNGGK